MAVKEKYSIIDRIILRLCHQQKLNFIPDKIYLSLLYRVKLGKRLNLKNPTTFNEKLQWLKLYDRRDAYEALVDKYAVKEYVKERIGEEYIIPTIGVWDRAEDIDFNALPDKFVLKCNHDSGSIVICKDKLALDQEKAIEKLKRGLKHSGYWHYREWPYKGAPRKIIAEKYMVDDKTQELRDYKFFCFNGEVRCFKIDFDRFVNHRANYYSKTGELLPFGEIWCPPDFKRNLPMPVSLNKMVELAEQLSSGYPFLRVDFYEVNGQIYFGELTFFPAAGFGAFVPEEWDQILGSWIELPQKQ